ncbi:hypothetical protein PT300_13470 [Enterobacteriaceae bacterium ESL0689]|nr:hypothetical protein [Enterobacteriaceae bacterium ESL0689]
MRKSLTARCIRRWQVEFKPLCDSAKNPYWCKRDLRGYIKSYAIASSESIVCRRAEKMAKINLFGHELGWSPEFADYFYKNREKYLEDARKHFNKNATTEEIDDEMERELEAWND